MILSYLHRWKNALGAFIMTAGAVSAQTFTPGDVFWSTSLPNLNPPVSGQVRMMKITGPGDYSAAPVAAVIPDRVHGQMVFTADRSSAYLPSFFLNRVLTVSPGGVVNTTTPFATAVNRPTGMLLVRTGPLAGRLLVASFGSDTVLDITAGGSFAGATPYATGANSARALIQLQDGRIMVCTSLGLRDITAGGAAIPFATGISPRDVYQLPSGEILVSTANGVYDVTAGGNFAAAAPYASGKSFAGLTLDAQGRLLASVQDVGEIFNITGGGNFAAASPFAFNLPGQSDIALDTVPGDPLLVTTAAATVNGTNVTLNGTVNPGGLETSVYFEYGQTPALGSSTTPASAGSGFVVSPFSTGLNGLLPFTTYYYRAHGTNVFGSASGSIVSFDTGSPDSAPTVTLLGDNPLTFEAAASYTDPGATASDVEDGMLTPTITSSNVVSNVVGAYSVTWSATDSLNQTGTATRTVQVVDTTPPQISGTFTPLTLLEGTPLPDYTGQAVANDIVGVTSVVQSPAPGTVTVLGNLQVTLTAFDGAGNSAFTSFNVNVRPASPINTALYSVNQPVPGAGVHPRLSANAVFSFFGVPAINNVGDVAFLAGWKGAPSGRGIFVNGALLVASGDPVPGLPGVTFSRISSPVINVDGQIAFISTVKGSGVTVNNNTVVVTNAPGGSLTVAAREGQAAAGADGGVYKLFRSVSLKGGEVLISAKLRTGTGSPAVQSTTDTGIWRVPGGLVVRESVSTATGLNEGETIQSFRLLASVVGTSAAGGQHALPGVYNFAATTSTFRYVLLTYADGTLGVNQVNGDSLNSTALPSATWRVFGLPATSANGSTFALRGALEKSETVSLTSATGIFLTIDGGGSFEPIARVSGEVPGLPGVTFGNLRDPAIAADSAGVFFAATLRGTGVTAANDASLWWQPAGGDLALVAREGTQASEVAPGITWKGFSSIALPGGATGPLVLASLTRGSGNVDTTNDLGVWGVDSYGDLRLLFREGDQVNGKVLKSFAVLKTVGGSAGVARAFNDAGAVIWRATFQDNTASIMRTDLP